MSLLSQLNDSQRAAVEYCDGPSLVIAGAGSGKTRVLTYKIAYMLQQGMEPWAILALTFTNKAAREMKERIAKLVGDEKARYLHMGTFHSVFSHILRRRADLLGYDSHFTIYDQSDSESLLRKIIKDEGLDDKQYKLKDVAGDISRAKNKLLTPDTYRVDAQTKGDGKAKRPALVNIYGLYQTRLRQANAMDFDDLLLNTYLLFERNEDVRREYAERYKFVLVDEYQDTNYAQKEIVLQLTRERQRVCVVGDDAQSIYSFRGAEIRNILDFQSTYTGVRLFKLERNYRSTQNIVGAADSLISHNSEQIRKHVYSENDKGERVQIVATASDQEEAALVCQDIARHHRTEALPYDSFAILYRTNAQSRSFEERLRKDGIPYRIFGGLSFYQRKEIKDIVAYYRLVDNPDDEEAFRRVINYPKRGIGNTTIEKLALAATNAGKSLWQMACNPDDIGLYAEGSGLNAGTCAKIARFTGAIKQWQKRAADTDAYTLGYDIVQQSGIAQEIYSSREVEDLARQQNVEEFLAALHNFVEERQQEGESDISLSAFLQDISLLTDSDTQADDDTPRVSLMTVHSAKGLEFHTVYVVGVEENIFPLLSASTSPRELEEERRLLYVAVTRAECRCLITFARFRFRYGKSEFDNPSRFLMEFSKEFVEGVPDLSRNTATPKISTTAPWRSNWERMRLARENPAKESSGFSGATPWRSRASSTGTPSTPSSPFSEPSPTLSPGITMLHNRFGRGLVLSVEGTGENTKARVRFERAGEKLLLLKFATYEIIN